MPELGTEVTIDAVDTGTITRVSVGGVPDEATAIAAALDYTGSAEYDSVEDQGGGSYEVVISR